MLTTARLCSNVGYAFVHMERKEEALAAIDALNGTMFKGRQLAVELSKAQPLVNQMGSGGNSAGAQEARAQCLYTSFTSVYSCICLLCLLAGGLLPRPPLSIEHQSQAAVLAAAAAAAAGLPIQVSLVRSGACTFQMFIFRSVLSLLLNFVDMCL